MAAKSPDALQSVVSAKLPDDLLIFVEDFRWTNRLTRSQIVLEAVRDWAIKKGFPAEDPIEDSPTDGGN